MTCSCGCNFVFNVATTAWRADHARRWAEGGRDTSDNLYPIMVKHDAGVGGKAADDTREIAKGKRNRLKHMGVKKRKGPPMAGSRDSKFKRKMDGSVERR